MNEINLEKVKLEEILKFYNNIDGVALTVENGRVESIVSSNMSGLHLKMWKNNRGGVLKKDIQEFYKIGVFPEYFIISDGTNKFLIRIIDEDEEQYFVIRNLIHGKLKDANYMILRDFNQIPQKNNEYIEQVSLDIYEEENEHNDDLDIPLIEDEASFDHNVSLFED